MTYKITGGEAVRLAVRDGLTLRTEAGEVGIAEARSEIAQSGEASVWVQVTPDGWWDGQRCRCAAGYSVEHYFTLAGDYLGPDCDGVEPTWTDAT